MNSSYHDIYQLQHQYFRSGATRSLSFRKKQLRKLAQVLREHEAAINEALYKDLGKHPQEVYMTDIGPVYEEINTQLAHLDAWARPQKVSSPLFLFPGSSWLYPEPQGNVLIISPWNYPFLLTFRGVAGAIAAGNTVIIKPSEFSAHSAALMEKIINSEFPAEFLHVFTGDGATVVTGLLNDHHFDHIMFTGSTSIGSKVMELAAKHLSPVTLELGGKSPCIIAADANITIAAKRILWGKMVCAGQSCVAPDYLLVHESVKDRLVQALIEQLRAGYGDDPLQSDSMGSLINEKRFDTVAAYIKEGRVLHGGRTDRARLKIEPTLIDQVDPEARVMKEEIFGPVLPIFTFKELPEALELIERNPYPLALYVFTNTRSTEKYFIQNVRFGGGAVNETILQLGNSELPFGGVGYSGHGGYLGKHSFETFSHYKGIVKRSTWFEPFFRHAPFSLGKTKLWRFLLGRK